MGGSPAPNLASVEPIQAPPSSSSSPDTNVGPEFVAVILAATAGTRLFPLTSEGDDEHGGHGGGGGLSDDDDEFDALPQEPDIEDGGRDNGGTGDGNVGAKEAEAAAGTSSDDDDPTVPKHLLPVAGTSIVRRLLGSVASAGFSRCVVAVAASDNGLTAKSILAEEAAASSGVGGSSSISRVGDHVLRLVIGGCSSSSAGGGGKKGKGSTDGAVKTMEISIVSLGANCGGSADAIRHLSGAGAVPASSHLVILPGDLVLAASLGDGSSLRLLADAHRRGQQSVCTRSERAGDASFAPPACTVLLSDVGDEDENGIPLKESAKVRSEREMSLVFRFVRYRFTYASLKHVFILICAPSKTRARRAAWQETRKILSTSVSPRRQLHRRRTSPPRRGVSL